VNYKLILDIALTHIFSRPKQSIVATLGVTFGISMFITMIAFMTGVNNLLEDTMLASSSHIKIYNEITNPTSSILNEIKNENDTFIKVWHKKPKKEQSNLKNGFNIVKQLKANPEVYGTSPQLHAQVFYNYGPHLINGIIAGVDIAEEDKLFTLSEKIIAGNMNHVNSIQNAIIMGNGLAKKFDLNVGDNIQVKSIKGSTFLLKIVSIFQSGIAQIDNTRSYSTLQTTQKILGEDKTYITEINIKLNDVYKANALAPILEKRYGYRAEDWETANKSILESFVMRNFMTFVIVCTILVVAGFGIYNIMNMTIYEKMKEIAILNAIGLNGNDIKAIFLLQSFFIGFVGAITGLILGRFLSHLISLYKIDNSDYISMTYMPVNNDPMFYVYGLLFGVLTTILAGYMPARKAAKLDPIEIIRGQ